MVAPGKREGVVLPVTEAPNPGPATLLLPSHADVDAPAGEAFELALLVPAPVLVVAVTLAVLVTALAALVTTVAVVLLTLFSRSLCPPAAVTTV